MDNQNLDDGAFASGQGKGGNARIGVPEPDAHRPLIDRNSKEPEARGKRIYWLAAMVSALSAQPQLERMCEVASSALKDGIDWRSLYEAATSVQRPQRNPPPTQNLINPER